jgi:twinkle protein
MTSKTFADYGIEIPFQVSPSANGDVYTQCPECSKHRRKKRAPCLSVNIDKGVWLCHHCGWKGGLNKPSTKDSSHWRKPEYIRPKPKPLTDLPRQVVEWFAGRGISESTLKRNRIGYSSIYMPQVEDWVNAVTFPYYRGDELINVKYRDGEKHFRMEAGAERILYGLNDLTDVGIIVEGEIDKLSLEEGGFKNGLSVPDGAPTPESKDYAGKFSFLDADKDKLEAVKEWVLAVDNDAPGVRLENELSRRLGREKCKKVTWPAGCKDANEVLIKLGKAALKACIEQAEPYPIEGVFTVGSQEERILFLYEHGWEKGVTSGWPTLDEYYTVRPGEFTVITGIPNSGKSNWLDALIVNLAILHGWRIGIFSAENQPIHGHMARIIEKLACEPFGDGPTSRMSRDTLQDTLDWAHNHFYWILPDDDDDGGWTVEAVLDRARVLVFRYGITGLVLDPWNEFEHERPEGLTETEYVSRTLSRVRKWARRYGVHIWMVAHPTKLKKDKDNNYPIPNLYDISGSAHWRNKADNGIVIWRDLPEPDQKRVEVHIQKIRFPEIGHIGMMELDFQPVTKTYQDFRHKEDKTVIRFRQPPKQTPAPAG